MTEGRDVCVTQRFADIAYAAMCEAGHPDVIVPAFEHDGVPYLEFDTEDYPEDSDEFVCLVRAEKLAQAAVRSMSLAWPAVSDPRDSDTPGRTGRTTT